MNATENCYLCGIALNEINRTRDHVPPRGIFAKPLPDNLITVPCCQPCNNGNHKADEVFRSIMSMAYKRNPAGDKIWQRVVDRTLPAKRIKAEIDAITATAKRITDPHGNPCVQMIVNRRPLNLQLIRITRGLLATAYPDIKSSNLEWEITIIHQFRVFDALMTGVTDMLPHTTRGLGNEFQFWHAISADTESSGFWVYLFYNCACFTVTHRPRGTIYRKNAAVLLRRFVE
jgi:hypothetical protein